jgi:GNAT superfamily N-acetyltransferase
MELVISSRIGRELEGVLDEVARLRISVFREFPYLYEGDAVVERGYLAGYAAVPASILVMAEMGGRVVGVSSGLPLADVDPAFRAPFDAAGLEVGDWFYCAESVLEPAWRGRGIGHCFFDRREAHARSLGFKRVCFCAVERPPDHPLKPAGYRPNDGFWLKRGYVRRPKLRAEFCWRQIDSERDERCNELVFWCRELSDQM